MEKKSNKVTIILLVIIIIILLALLVLSLTGTITLKETENNDNEEPTPEVTTLSEITTILTDESITQECLNGCTKNINIDSTQYNIYASEKQLKLNNQEIIKYDENSTDSILQVTNYQDIIIVLERHSLSVNLKIYDKTGIQIKEIGTFTDEQARLFNTYLRYNDTEDFHVDEDGTIYILGTKHIQGVANTYLTDAGDTIDLCTQGQEIQDDEIVSGIFKFSYLGNSNFSDIKYFSTNSTIKDIKECN